MASQRLGDKPKLRDRCAVLIEVARSLGGFGDEALGGVGAAGVLRGLGTGRLGSGRLTLLWWLSLRLELRFFFIQID